MRELIRELIETVLLALLIFLVLQFSVQNFRVEGSSMQPTLTEGQYLLVNKIVYLRVNTESLASLLPWVGGDADQSLFAFHQPEQGEVIIFHFPKDPSRDFVKRVIGVPGDVIEIREGKVSINGVALDEPYITHPDSRTIGRIEVPLGSFYVLGDNRRASNDSRDWGFVPAENVIGRAWVSYWPPENFNVLSVFTQPLGLGAFIAASVLH
ncbi:MAG: signal peptidase I [Chloroflexi bacterium]|nr:signal peptidase I [Chloroflexota bacterium]